MVIWITVCKKPLDELPYDFVYFFKELLLSELEWNEVYDVIEIICSIVNSKQSPLVNIENQFNYVLKIENSAYRIIDNSVTPIVDDCEINEINEVLNCKYDVVKNQIKTL